MVVTISLNGKTPINTNTWKEWVDPHGAKGVEEAGPRDIIAPVCSHVGQL